MLSFIRCQDKLIDNNMINLKKYKQKIESFIKSKKNKKIKRAYLIILSIVLIIFFYFFYTLTSISSNRVLFANLNDSYKSIGICHEACILDRTEKENIIILAWPKEDKLFIDFKNYWHEAVLTNNEKQQKLLLALIYETSSREEICPLLIENLASSEITDATKANIVYYFSNLKSYDLSAYSLDLLESNNQKLLSAAIYSLTNEKDAIDICSSEKIYLIKDFINRQDVEIDVKLDALFLLRNCERTEELEEVLMSVINQEKDKVLLYFAIEGLQALGNYNYPLPSLSPEEVSNYFNY